MRALRSSRLTTSPGLSSKAKQDLKGLVLKLNPQSGFADLARARIDLEDSKPNQPVTSSWSPIFVRPHHGQNAAVFATRDLEITPPMSFIIATCTLTKSMPQGDFP